MIVESAEKLRVSEFTSHLAVLNNLDQLGFDRFVFFPGMLFLSFNTWWGKNSIRKTAHEGLDVCFFINIRQNQFRLDETIRIPILFEGEIVHIMEDFLGQTIVARHRTEASGGKFFLSFYAHIIPDRRLTIGDVIKAGEPLGTIVDPKKVNSPLVPHLHISLAWESMLPPSTLLTWNILNQVDRSAFFDPLKVLSGSHKIFESPPDEHTINNFTKCSLALKNKP
jgi:hypothetical protein